MAHGRGRPQASGAAVRRQENSEAFAAGDSDASPGVARERRADALNAPVQILRPRSFVRVLSSHESVRWRPESGTGGSVPAHGDWRTMRDRLHRPTRLTRRTPTSIED